MSKLPLIALHFIANLLIGQRRKKNLFDRCAAITASAITWVVTGGSIDLSISDFDNDTDVLAGQSMNISYVTPKNNKITATFCNLPVYNHTFSLRQ